MDRSAATPNSTTPTAPATCSPPLAGRPSKPQTDPPAELHPAGFTRRDALKLGVAGAGAAVVAPWFPGVLAAAEPAAGSHAPFVLPPLPYAADALEPHIDARTMEIHHGKHHAGYVAKLNAALENEPDLAGLDLEDLLRRNDLPEAIATAVRNNGGGHHNHALFWTGMKKGGGGVPTAELAGAVDAAFGSYDNFKDEFTKTALGIFGSGWAWLCIDAAGKATIAGMPNQDSALRDGLKPLLGLDVWEHAYYLNYQNRRADYVAAWFNVIDWDAIASRYEAAAKA